MAGAWSSTNVSGPGIRNTAGMAESAGGGLGRDEKASLRQAKEAERAFRASKGYVHSTIWNPQNARFSKRRKYRL